MKRLLVIIFAVICGMVFSEGFAKKPTRPEMTEEEMRAMLDSIKSKQEHDFDKGGGRGWDRAAKFTHYYCLGDYLLEDGNHSEYLQLEDESVKFRFKLLELCPNYTEDSDLKDAVIAYTMHDKETDPIACGQKAVTKAINNIFDILQHRLRPVYAFGELYLKPNDATEEITCDKLWKANLIKVSGKPEGLLDLYHTRQSAEQADSVIRANTLICDTTIKVEDEYRSFVVAKMPIKPFEEWLDTLMGDAEEKETWKVVLHELLYNPTNESRVVVGRVHFAL